MPEVLVLADDAGALDGTGEFRHKPSRVRA
jgi:hypothetical protein